MIEQNNRIELLKSESTQAVDLLRTSETEKAVIISKLREVERERDELKEEIEEY